MNKSYEKIQLLGKGSYGEAYLVRDIKTQILYVLKEIKKQKTASAQNQRIKYLEEHNNMKNLDHINIVKIYHIYEDSTFYYIVME